MAKTIRVTQRLEMADEGVAHEGRCEGCGRVYRTALFLDHPTREYEPLILCDCGLTNLNVEMQRMGTVRHRSPSLPIFEGMK